VGALVGGGQVVWVVARFEQGKVQILTPVFVVEVGQRVEPEQHVLAVMLAARPTRGDVGDLYHRLQPVPFPTAASWAIRRSLSPNHSWPYQTYA
jgi:hypothetical protein